MPERKWDKDKERERKRAYRAQRKAEREQPTVISTPAEAEAFVAANPDVEYEEAPVVQQAALEQALRDHWGYSASEKRTQAERQAVADRIIAKCEE